MLRGIEQSRTNYPDLQCEGELAAIRSAQASADGGGDLRQLNGVEGAASRAYFQVFGRMCRGDLTFEGRKRRPPTHPVNALLSFGYVLIYNELQSLLDGMGFDPYLGFYHDLDYGRASLAADLLEEFRHPLVDRLTLQLVNWKILKSEHFVTDERNGAVNLNAAGMKAYFRHYERFLNGQEAAESGVPAGGLRTIFRRQAEHLARHVQGEDSEYIPFT